MKILLVDDHVVVREGVRQLISTLPDVSVLEADNGEAALVSYSDHRPDLVILDLRFPSGIGGTEVIRGLLALDNKARMIVFSIIGDPMLAGKVLGLGARGYVSKAAGADELVAAIRCVMEGRRYIERDIANQLAFAKGFNPDPFAELTAREVQILKLLGTGSSLIQIADTIGLTYKTVANSCSIIKSKLGVERTANLIRLSLGLVSETGGTSLQALFPGGQQRSDNRG